MQNVRRSNNRFEREEGRYGQRVLDSECPTIETSVSSKGTAKEIQINETLTFIGKPSSPGIIRGKGHGVFISAESDMAGGQVMELVG